MEISISVDKLGKKYIHDFLNYITFAKLSSSWQVQSSPAELRISLILVISTHPPNPNLNSSDTA